MVRLAAYCCCGVVSSDSEEEEKEVGGEEGEKSDMNFFVRLDLRLLVGLDVGVIGGAACSSHSADGVRPNLVA